MEAIVFIIPQIVFATRAVLKIGEYYTLYVWSRGKQFCFPESPDVSRDEVEGNIRLEGK